MFKDEQFEYCPVVTNWRIIENYFDYIGILPNFCSSLRDYVLKFKETTHMS